MTAELTSGWAKKHQVGACAPCRRAKSSETQDCAACIIARTVPPKSRRPSAKDIGRLWSQFIHLASRWFRSSLFSGARREHHTLRDQISPMNWPFPTRILFWRRTTVETRDSYLASNNREVHGPAPKSAVPELADISGESHAELGLGRLFRSRAAPSL